jgi:hypothetical protein
VNRSSSPWRPTSGHCSGGTVPGGAEPALAMG